MASSPVPLIDDVEDLPDDTTLVRQLRAMVRERDRTLRDRDHQIRGLQRQLADRLTDQKD